MLALVKKPHIELSIHGEHIDELLAWIQKKYDVAVLADKPDDELVPIESTDFWKEMEKNRIGNLLAGARLKAGLRKPSSRESWAFVKTWSVTTNADTVPTLTPWPSGSAQCSR